MSNAPARTRTGKSSIARAAFILPLPTQRTGSNTVAPSRRTATRAPARRSSTAVSPSGVATRVPRRKQTVRVVPPAPSALNFRVPALRVAPVKVPSVRLEALVVKLKLPLLSLTVTVWVPVVVPVTV